MKRFVGKISALATFSLVLGSSIHAVMDDRLDTLEKEMQEISARNPQGTLGASFTSAQAEVKNQYNWFFTFDILYWHAKAGGTEYAYTLEPNTQAGLPPNVLPPVDGQTKDNDFSWDLGLKVGLGYKLPHDDWDIYANYTWFDTEDSSSSTKAAPSALAPHKSVVNFLAHKAKSHFDIGYNNVDLELGRSYFMSSRMSVRPHIGVKSAWVDLDQDVIYTLGEAFVPGILGGFDTKTKAHLRFWGVGPRAGINTRLHLGYGFSLYGDAAGSILYGYFKTRHRETFPPHLVQLTDGNGEVIKVKHKFHRFIPYANLNLGLAFNRFINEEKQHIGFKLGYEVQYYWRVNQMKQPEDFSQTQTFATNFRVQLTNFSEDVMFYGITGEFRLDF